MYFSKFPIEIIFNILSHINHYDLYSLISANKFIAQVSKDDQFWRQMCKLHFQTEDRELEIFTRTRPLQEVYLLMVRYRGIPMIREFNVPELTDKVAIMPYYVAWKFFGLPFSEQLEAPIFIRMDYSQRTFKDILTCAKTITLGLKKSYAGIVLNYITIEDPIEIIDWEAVSKENTFVSFFISEKKYYFSRLNNHKESNFLKNIQSDYTVYYQ